ncbi:MAG: cytochrome c [Deltaproteobacteria bacterium]|nr:cytochrome c [Deltaproteobacteria bacterium]
MKRALLIAVALGLSAGTSFAMDHSQMHEMMMKQGGPKPDTRTELKLPEPMKVMQKSMMRQHLDTVSQITAALASNELNRAASIAKDNLGWNESQEKMCSVFGESAGKEFLDLGMAMHKKADELADNAKASNRDKALENLSQLIKNCNACHEKFRH